MRSPEQSAGLFSRLYFRWVRPTLDAGVEHPLTIADLLPLHEEEDPQRCETAFKDELVVNAARRRPVLRSMWEIHKRALAGVFGISMFHLVASVASPLLLRELVHELGGGGGALALTLAVSLFVSALATSMTAHHIFHRNLRLMVRVRIGLVTAIYRKSLALTIESRQRAPAGRIINLMGTDAQKFVNMLNVFHSLWLHPMQLTLVMAILYWILGPASLAGAAILLMFLYLASVVARKGLVARKELVKHSDERVGLMNEILMSIRVLKFYAWERSFEAEAQQIRGREVVELRKLAKLGSLGQLLFFSSPVVVAVATFATYVLSGHALNAADVFASLALFTVLRQAMVMLPDMLTLCMDANVSIKRVEEFLALPELAKRAPSSLPAGTISLKGAAFSWTKTARALSGLDLEVRRGELVVVVGAVGSGKSALIASLLGDLELVAGTADVAGSVAFVSQQAWILNDTIRANVLFGLELDEARYERALAVSSMLADLAHFPGGDATEIGERGVNLSGGQRQRISLARAIYADADVYLLDDPLSALDAQVAHAVYDDAILGALKGKTRILATHRLEFVDRADRLIVLDGGVVVESGRPRELKRKSKYFFQLWRAYERAEGNAEATEEEMLAAEAEADVPAAERVSPARGELGKPATRIMTEEERNTGVVGWGVYKLYFKTFAPGAIAAGLSVAFLTKELLGVGTDSWLAYWSTAKDFQAHWFLLGYLAFGIAACTSTFIRSLIITLRGLTAGTIFHNGLLKSVLAAPMGFFEGTPVGRVLNRFARDMEAVDQQIPRSLLDALGCIFTIVSTLVVVVLVTPAALFAIVPIGFIYWQVQKTFRPASREGQRLDSITRSPVFAQFSETLAGVAVIRAFGAERRFERSLLGALETNSRTFYTLVSANRWLGTRIETLGAGVVAAAAIASVATTSSLGAGFVGLSVTYALAITGAMNWAVRMVSQVESNLNSVERIEHYTRLPSERWAGARPPEGWPSAGEVRFDKVTLRYRPDLPPVARELDCTIRAGEKVGIVGRTGAGKSTLLLSLFRILEPEAGRISIDGVDVAGLDLAALRSRLAIIPQEPTLFSGTIRKNLDPFAVHDEARLWDALARAALKESVQRLPKGLDTNVHEGGSNFSVGQKQLLCLARALLKDAKVLLLDEATASVDVTTDAWIQRTIREEFRDATVITIAHRLGTVMDSDRIMVMEQGRVVEFDAPEVLMGRSGGHFAAMLAEG